MSSGDPYDSYTRDSKSIIDWNYKYTTDGYKEYLPDYSSWQIKNTYEKYERWPNTPKRKEFSIGVIRFPILYDEHSGIQGILDYNRYTFQRVMHEAEYLDLL
jgi:hypothetical protein